MAKIRTTALRFPSRGVVKSSAWSEQPPLTTPDALNVWPESQEDGRERGGTRPGLDKIFTNQVAGSTSRVNLLADLTYIDQAQQRKRAVVAASGGTLSWAHPGSTTWLPIASSVKLASNVYLQAAYHLGKLYIADWSLRPLSGTNGTTGASPSDVNLLSASYPNWLDVSEETINAADYVVVVRSTGNGIPGNYTIDSFTTTVTTNDTIVLDSSPGDSLTGVHFYVERAPKIFDPLTQTLSLWVEGEDAGTWVPVGNPIITVWHDRIVLCGGHDAPHNWYMSRAGNANNWNYTAGDVVQAVAGNNSDAGQIGQPLNALIPHKDTSLLFGAEDSLWVMLGDPADGGTIENLSERVGIVKGKAWCETPENAKVFLTKDGVYAYHDQTGLQSISREVLPEDLLFMDGDANWVLMAYDKQLRAIHLYIIPRGAL